MSKSITLESGQTWTEVKCPEGFLNMADKLHVTDATMVVDGILNTLELNQPLAHLCNLYLNGTSVARIQYGFGELKVFRSNEIHFSRQAVPHTEYPISFNVDFIRND